jgi:hypothetical protein
MFLSGIFFVTRADLTDQVRAGLSAEGEWGSVGSSPLAHLTSAAGWLGSRVHHISWVMVCGKRPGGLRWSGFREKTPVGACRIGQGSRKLQGVAAARHEKERHGRIVCVGNACKYGRCMVATERFVAGSGMTKGGALGGVGRAAF